MRPRSQSLFHFTNQAESLFDILKAGFWPKYCLEDIGWQNFEKFDYIAFPMVCFCDIPLSRIAEHTGYYGSYGIGLKKEWAEKNALNPVLYISSPCEDSPMPSPDTLGGSTFAVHLYVDDVDAMFEQAIDAGALDIRSVEDQFYGDRMGTLKDPFGHIWFVSTHLEDLTQEEIQERSEAVFST
jgi:hypothetical protein